MRRGVGAGSVAAYGRVEDAGRCAAAGLADELCSEALVVSPCSIVRKRRGGGSCPCLWED